MAKAIKINFPILRLLPICVALVSLLNFHRVTCIEGVSQFPVSERLSVDDPLIQINLRCTYETYGFTYYCKIYDLDIRITNIEVASFTGSHTTRKTDEDVTGIWFINGTMFYLPNGIGNSFKNLREIRVERGLGTKLITRSNFLSLENLEELNVKENEIEVLPFDTLWDLPGLKVFWLDDNKLNAIDEKTFDKNLRLNVVNLSSNRLEFLPRNLFKNNVLLRGVNFGENSLKNIAIDFTLLKNLEGQDFEKITALQRQIRANCNSTN